MQTPGRRISPWRSTIWRKGGQVSWEEKQWTFWSFENLWTKKMRYIYTMEYYLAIKEKEIMPFAATWMDLEIVILREVSQTEKVKYRLSLICGI